MRYTRWSFTTDMLPYDTATVTFERPVDQLEAILIFMDIYKMAVAPRDLVAIPIRRDDKGGDDGKG